MAVGIIDKAIGVASQIWTLRKEIKDRQDAEKLLVKELYQITERVEGVYEFDLRLTNKVDYKGVLAALSVEYGIKPEALAAAIEKHTAVTESTRLDFAKNYHI